MSQPVLSRGPHCSRVRPLAEAVTHHPRGRRTLSPSRYQTMFSVLKKKSVDPQIPRCAFRFMGEAHAKKHSPETHPRKTKDRKKERRKEGKKERRKERQKERKKEKKRKKERSLKLASKQTQQQISKQDHIITTSSCPARSAQSTAGCLTRLPTGLLDWLSCQRPSSRPRAPQRSPGNPLGLGNKSLRFGLARSWLLLQGLRQQVRDSKGSVCLDSGPFTKQETPNKRNTHTQEKSHLCRASGLVYTGSGSSHQAQLDLPRVFSAIIALDMAMVDNSSLRQSPDPTNPVIH